MLRLGLLSAAIVALFFFYRTDSVAETNAASCRHVKDSIERSMQWMIKNQKPNGLYTYEIYPFDEVKGADSQNLVRQIGSYWSVIASLHVLKDHEGVTQSIREFSDGVRQYVKQGKHHNKTITYIEYDDVIKLNSAALFTLALVEMEELGLPVSQLQKQWMDELVEGMKGMEADHGAYWYAYYVPKEHNIITSYGSAEALLAFVRVAKLRGDKGLEQYAYDQFKRYYDYYIKPLKRFDESSELKAYFSWALQMLSLLTVEEEAILYERYVRPLIKLAIDYRASNTRCADQGCINSPYATDGVFYEGIVTAWGMVRRHEKDNDFISEYEDYIERGKDALITYQIHEEQDRELINKSPRKPDELIGGFCGLEMDCDFLRNDINQHVTNALRYYYQQACQSK